MSKLLFPLQFERQYSGPIDVSQIFETTSERLLYLENPSRYAGQIVSDLQEEKVYQLNSASDSWIEIGGSGTVKTTTTETPGFSAITNIVAVSAAPLVQEKGFLYFVIS